MKKIVIVDDETDFCSSMKESLELTGDFEVETCSDGQAAVPLIQRFQPNLILLDIRMPGLTGDEIAEQLKKQEATRNIPVVFLTALVTDEEMEERGNVIGGHYFVAKPVRSEELLRLIQSIVR